MEVHLTAELEAKLTHSAAQQGRNPDELVHDLLMRYFEGAPPFAEGGRQLHGRSGTALIEAMQASPYKDVDLQPRRERLPVRDAVL
jgi:hypothetical protein